jgi:hypothetical protein
MSLSESIQCQILGLFNDQGLIPIGFHEGDVFVLFLQFSPRACNDSAIPVAHSLILGPDAISEEVCSLNLALDLAVWITFMK